MSNLIKHAESELKLMLDELTSESDTTLDDIKYQKEINKCIMQLIETISKQGHSGFSVNYVMAIFKRLVEFKPLTALTGNDDEWVEYSKGMFQNKRCPEIFKDKNGKTEWINGRIFSDDGGNTWYRGNNSRVEITFPFRVPGKPEKIIVNEEQS